jgi:hypothetical protein
MITKTCPKCGGNKSMNDFYFNKTLGTYFSWCKLCSKTRATESRRRLRSSPNFEDQLTTKLYDFLSWTKNRNKHRKKIDNTLSMKILTDLWNKQEGKCYYTGTPMKINAVGENIRDPLAISIDRIDSSRGYISGNIVFCCWGINALKGIKPPDVMYNSLKLFYENAKTNGKIK